MAFPVTFKAKVTGGISHLDVLIQGDPVPCPGGNVSETEHYSSHGNIIIRFRISGFNGTGFKIVYSCSSNSIPAIDTANPTPITETIDEDGFKEITLRIPV